MFFKQKFTKETSYTCTFTFLNEPTQAHAQRELTSQVLYKVSLRHSVVFLQIWRVPVCVQHYDGVRQYKVRSLLAFEARVALDVASGERLKHIGVKRLKTRTEIRSLREFIANGNLSPQSSFGVLGCVRLQFLVIKFCCIALSINGFSEISPTHFLWFLVPGSAVYLK